MHKIDRRTEVSSRQLIDALVEGRDDIGHIPIPHSGKVNARQKGKDGMNGQLRLKRFVKMNADLVNGGKVMGFRNKDVGAKT